MRNDIPENYSPIKEVWARMEIRVKIMEAGHGLETLVSSRCFKRIAIPLKHG